MKLFLPAFIMSFFVCCSQDEKNRNEVPEIQQETVPSPINYDSSKEVILHTKQANKPAWANISRPEKEKIFTTAVTETIIPNWIGTAWDFNGTSEIPQQGSIACGYFVTTILRDAGLNLARIKLAQCTSEQMIVSLVQSKYIHRYRNVLMKDFLQSIEEQGFGLFIVGLDNHTGFVYNDGIDIYFIHSTFVGTRNVQKEKAGESWILQQSKYKILGKISADEKVLDKWIN